MFASEQLDISGVGSDDDWTLDGAASKAIALSDTSDTSGIVSDPGAVQDLAFTNPAVVDGDDEITNVTVTVRVKWMIAQATTLDYVVGDGTGTSPGTFDTAGNSDFVDETISMDSPPSGGSWTLAKLQGLVIELTAPGVFGTTFYVSKVKAVVTYTPVSASSGSRSRIGGVMVAEARL